MSKASKATGKKKAGRKKRAAPLGVIAIVPDGGTLPAAIHAFAAALTPARDVLEAPSVKEGLALRTRAPVLVVTDTPDHRVAMAFEAGDDAAAALAGWTTESLDLIAALKSTTRRVEHVTRQALAVDPVACAEALAAAFELELGPLPEVPVSEVDAPADTVWAGLAWLMVEGDDEARSLVATLYGTIRLIPRISVETLTEARAWLSQNARPMEHDAADRLEAECTLLREDMVQMQGRLEQRVLDASLGQSALKAATNRQVLIEERAQKREAVLGAGLLSLGAQRDAIVPELIDLTEQVARLTEELEAAQAELAAANSTLDDVYNSRSWRVTQPMRAARKGLGKS